MFPLKDITTALNIKAAISNDMVQAIENWYRQYVGQIYADDEHITSLELEKAICREFANISVNEMTVSVSNDRLEQAFQKAVKDIQSELRLGLATGSMVIKPLGVDTVQFVSAHEFIPVEYDDAKRLTKVIFPEVRKIDGKYYTRLEYHCLDQNGLAISNTAYLSHSEGLLGREVPLSMVDEWANIAPNTVYPLMTRPAFGYYRNPIDNDIDRSSCGMSVYSSAVPLIRKADAQASRLDWEFESAERAIHADAAAFKGNKLPKGKERLYRKVDIDAGGKDLFETYSPEIRDERFINGLEEYKREIEFAVGLSYGDLSTAQTVDKTATEVRASKQRKYNTVSAIQENLRQCLDDLVYALAFYNSLTTSGYEFVCNFKDSILTDETEERKQDMQDVTMGIMRPEEYRAKWYAEDIETAKKNLPQSAEMVD